MEEADYILLVHLPWYDPHLLLYSLCSVGFTGVTTVFFVFEKLNGTPIVIPQLEVFELSVVLVILLFSKLEISCSFRLLKPFA
jgi:hypothetical protein